MVAGVKDLGVQGETASRSSPNLRLALSALLVVNACVCLLAIFNPYIATK